MDKVGRNDPCHCGSGKKMKKCCALPKAKKGFTATLLGQQAAPASSKLANLFQSNVQETTLFSQEKDLSLKQVIAQK